MLRKCFEVKQIAQNKVLEIYLYGEIRADWYDWWNGQVVESTTSANYVRKAVVIPYCEPRKISSAK